MVVLQNKFNLSLNYILNQSIEYALNSMEKEEVLS